MRFILAAIIALTLASPSVAENPDAKARMKLADKVTSEGTLIWRANNIFYLYNNDIYRCWTDEDEKVSNTPFLMCANQEDLFKEFYRGDVVEEAQPYLRNAVFVMKGNNGLPFSAGDAMNDSYFFYERGARVYICTETKTSDVLLCKRNSDPYFFPP